MKRFSISVGLMAVCLLISMSGLAQAPVPPPMPPGQLLAAPDLDQLLGPIALYPDPLLSELLPASTLPSQIVLADRYIQGGGDPGMIDAQPWDDAVKSMAHYPAVLKWLDDNLAWTTTVGQAFENQPQDVMDSIQRLRAEAMALGNLQSTPQEQVVTDDDGSIEIVPPNTDDMYVPEYDPATVYSQGGYVLAFGLALPLGIWLHTDFDWHNHHVFVWDHNHPRPADWWTRRPGQPMRNPPHGVAPWQPRDRPGTVISGQDRGWETHPVHDATPSAARGPARSPARVERPLPERAPPAMAEPRTEAPRATGALIGGGSSANEVRQFSSRGQQSRAAVAARSRGGRR